MFLKAGLLAVASAVVLFAAQPAFAKGSETYNDATGENPAAADITTVKVENDDDGRLTFSVAFGNMPELAADALVFVAFDTDRNARTGDSSGAEFLFLLDGSDRSYAFARWNGTTYDVVAGASLDVGFTAGTATVGLQRSQLGDVSTFDFFVSSVRGAEGAEVFDDAPDGTAAWTYSLVLRPVVDTIGAGFSPAQPTAGKAFAVRGVQLGLEDGKTVKPTSIRCTAKLAGKKLAGTGAGGCAWKLPKNAKGKKLVVTVTVAYRDATPVTATRTLKVR